MSGKKKANKPGNMTMRRKQLQQDSTVKMERQVIEWMDANVPVPKAAATIPSSTASSSANQELDAFVGTLATGVRLCQLIKKIDPSAHIAYNSDAKVDTFQALENITLFVKAARDLGVSGTLFEATDLPARSNDQGILTTLLYLSKIAHKRQHIKPPPSVQAELDAEAASGTTGGSDGKRTSHFDEKYKDGESISEPGGKASLETNDDGNDDSGVVIMNGHARGKAQLSVHSANGTSNGKANGVRVNGTVNGNHARIVAANGNTNGNTNGNVNGNGTNGHTSDTSPPSSPLIDNRANRSVGTNTSNGTSSPSSPSQSVTSSRRSSRDEGQPESLSHHLRQLRATMTWQKLITIIIAFPFWAVIELRPIIAAFIAELPTYIASFRVEVRRRATLVIERIRQRRHRIRQYIINRLRTIQNIVIQRVNQLRAYIQSWIDYAIGLFTRYVRQPIQRVYRTIVTRVNAVVAWIRTTIDKIRTFVRNTIETYIRAPIRRVIKAIVDQYNRIRESVVSLLRRVIVEPLKRVTDQIVSYIAGVYKVVIARYIIIREAIVARLIAIRTRVIDIITRARVYIRNQITLIANWLWNLAVTTITEVRDRLVLPALQSAVRVFNLTITQVDAWFKYVVQLHVNAWNWAIDRTWLVIQLWAEVIAAPCYQATERLIIWSWNTIVVPVSQRAIDVANKVAARIAPIVEKIWSYISITVARARVIIARINERVQRIAAYIRQERDRVVAAIRAQAQWAFGVIQSIAKQINIAVIQPVRNGIVMVVKAINNEVIRLSTLARQLIQSSREYIRHIVESFKVAVSPFTKAINTLVSDARGIIQQIWRHITALFIAARREGMIAIASVYASVQAIGVAILRTLKAQPSQVNNGGNGNNGNSVAVSAAATPVASQ